MKIAVVGTGVSGLVCAHLLRRAHDVTVFEADARIGGHVHTVDVRLGGERFAVDTGFIVYNERTYPGLTKLFAQIGVATQPSDMSFGVACERSGVEWGSRSLGALLADPRNLCRPSFLRMLRDLRRFFRDAPRLLERDDPKLALGDWLCGAGYSREFVDLFLVPMGAAIWSAAPGDFLRFPAQSFVRFFANHGLLGLRDPVEWRVVQGGSRSYVEKLAAPFRDRIRTRCPLVAVRREGGGVSVVAAGGVHRFDRVVLACHSDQALALLDGASAAERQVLGAIRYQENEALLHTDASVMPRRRRAWASWNYRVPPRDAAAGERVFVSYHMNRLQNLRAPEDVFVTLNAQGRVDPARVLGRFVYHHPVFDADAIAAQRSHGAIDGAGGVHFAGAYWGWGFHEDGVRSACAVARRFGIEL
ncbi:MAG: FAD-dependent oxidoreductase [Proteobacteria bacterium]|nr:MAG: FAD-dependent oxidoreductase [Pseudomonadota bacterium]